MNNTDGHHDVAALGRLSPNVVTEQHEEQASRLCAGLGANYRPDELLQVGGPVTLAFL